MPSPKTLELLKGLVLSAQDLKVLTDWPDALVEDYLNIVDNLITLSNQLDVEIDKNLEALTYSMPQIKSYDSAINDIKKLFFSEPVNRNFESRISELERRLLVSESSHPIPNLESLEKKIISGVLRPSIVGPKLFEKQVTFPPAKNRPAGVGIPPASAVFGNYIGLEYDIGDKAYYELEVPYDCNIGRSIKIEVHWFIDEANDDPGGANEEQVQWRASYTLTKEDTTEAVDAASTDLDSGDIAIPGTAKFLVQSVCGEIAPGLFEPHDILGLCIERIAVTKDDPTNDPILLNVEIEYYSDIRGEPK